MNRLRGFTLIELMIATVVFTTVIVGLLAAFAAAAALTESSRNLTQAVEDARTIMERIRDDVQGSSDMAAFVNDFPESAYENWVVEQQAAETGFDNLSEETVDVTYGDPAEDPLEVTVEVTWEDRQGRERSTTLQTMMTRR